MLRPFIGRLQKLLSGIGAAGANPFDKASIELSRDLVNARNEMRRPIRLLQDVPGGLVFPLDGLDRSALSVFPSPPHAPGLGVAKTSSTLISVLCPGTFSASSQIRVPQREVSRIERADAFPLPRKNSTRPLPIGRLSST
jgi:hypothetical protein